MTEVAAVVEPPKAPEIKDLGKLACAEKLFVGLLPSNYSALIVNYSPRGHNDYLYRAGNFRVSCVQPPTTHNVQVRKEDVNRDGGAYWEMRDYHKLCIFKHKSPTTLLSLCYADYPSPQNVAAGNIWALDDSVEDKIMGIGYTLPNVGDNGDICWGGAGYPADLKAAHSRFWGSNFNHLNVGVGKSVTDKVSTTVEYVKRWKSVVYEKAKFRNLTQEICGTKFWSTTKKADGLLITNKKALLKHIPQEFWKKDPAGQAFIIALASKGEKEWVFDGGLFKFSIAADSLETVFSGRKKVQALLKKFGPDAPVVTKTKVATPEEVAAKETKPKKPRKKKEPAIKFEDLDAPKKEEKVTKPKKVKATARKTSK